MKKAKTDEELIEITDKAIAELVTDRTELRKAYNYYNGKRDAEQFKYLEDNFGIGSPTSVEFIPLIKKHIDALLGEYMGVPIIPKVSCKDSNTINNIFKEKDLAITEQIALFLKGNLRKAILSFINSKDITDLNIEQQLNQLIEELDLNFVSKYEIAAQNVIEYIMQSRHTDIHTKLRTLLLDLLVTGYTFYRVKPSPAENNVEIETLSPLDTFPDLNYSSPYIRDCQRCVVRKWMTPNQILNLYKNKLDKEEIKKLRESWESYGIDNSTYFIRGHSMIEARPTELNQEDVISGFPGENHTYRYIPVYEVEWIDVDEDFKMQRYKTVKIGGGDTNCYILFGKDDNVVRSQDHPDQCQLSVNGVCFLNRNNKPYSLVLACASLQDKYDLLHYYRDNLIANSGTIGDWIDETLIPQHLGVNFPERLKKWISYKKNGLGLINTSQEGALASGQAPINTLFNGYDDTVKSQAIQAIQIAIDSIEQTCSSITGVFRERLNGIEQRDAVTNVKQGVINSFIITKPIYQQMDLVTCEILLDCLNMAKIVYKHGLTGTLILGEKYQKVFTALAENFTLTDYDIHVITSTNVMEEMQQIKAVIPDLIKSNMFTPDIIFEALTAKSLTELKYKVRKSMTKQKQENDQLNQALQQIEQLQKQLEEAQKQLQQANSKIEQLNEAKLQIEKDKIRQEIQLEWFKAKTERDYKSTESENDTKRTNIELMQLTDGNANNDHIRQLHN